MAASVPVLLFAQTWSARPPRVIFRSEPEYSEEARRAGVNATINVSLVVGEDGVPRDIRIVRGAGFGLDEVAARTISSWRFEPGTKEGKPFPAPTHVDLHFSVLDKPHHGQTARLNFSLPADVSRPELLEGEIPSNPEIPADSFLRVRLTVGPVGQPMRFQTLDTNNQDWTEHALLEMAGWRFRPAMRDGSPEEVTGVFELATSQSVPENRPTLTRAKTISPPEAQDATLPAPQPISPPDHAIFDGYFDGYPRRVTCKWEPSPGAVSYILEWDYMDREAWHTESQGIPGSAYPVAATETTFDFVGAQPGRWRVWPVNARGQRGNPSPWRTFRYVN
jgi:TonB family protein